MLCKRGKLCNNFILSSSVTVVDGSLVVNIPNVPYPCGCLVVAQNIPDTVTLDTPVVVTIGADTTQYLLVDRCGVQISADRIDIRHRYPFRFISANTSSVFQIAGSRCPRTTISTLTV